MSCNALLDRFPNQYSLLNFSRLLSCHHWLFQQHHFLHIYEILHPDPVEVKAGW